MAEQRLIRINAPAGSGKTTYISNTIKQLIQQNSKRRILAITYTNRAAQELEKEIISPEVEISTIHSFLNSFVSPFYKLRPVIDSFLEFFEDQINVTLSNRQNIDRYINYNKLNVLPEQINLEYISRNIHSLYYTENRYDNFLTGGFSHDSLLEFSYHLMQTFPRFQKKLSGKYSHIFIDEVQDTSSAILNFFYEGIENSDTSLWLLGDVMQQIYDTYDGSFEEEYQTFDQSESENFQTNYRSSEEIVQVLNNLYLTDQYVTQSSYKGENHINPIINIVKGDIDEFLSNGNIPSDFLQLRTANRQRFIRSNSDNDLSDIFDVYNQIYPYSSKTTVIDAMLPIEDSPDHLLKFMYMLFDIKFLHQEDQYGKIIQLIRHSKISRKEYFFNQDTLKISTHSDKTIFSNNLQNVLNEFSPTSSMLLKNYLDNLSTHNIINNHYFNTLTDLNDTNKYQSLLDIPLRKFYLLAEYKNNPTISTQHGVKGEGHDKVIFVAEDNKRIGIGMYDFFKMFSEIDNFNLDSFQSFYYDFKLSVQNTEQQLGLKVKDINSNSRSYIMRFSNIYDTFNGNPYFNALDENISFTNNMSLGDFKELFNFRKYNYALTAYKLFYVGCSRAKEELIVVVKQDSLVGFKENFVERMENIGFVVRE